MIDDKEASEYVKAIIKNHPGIIPEKQILDAIFNELREEQSGKKNSNVEGITIQTTDEALNYCRHLTNDEISPIEIKYIPTYDDETLLSGAKGYYHKVDDYIVVDDNLEDL